MGAQPPAVLLAPGAHNRAAVHHLARTLGRRLEGGRTWWKLGELGGTQAQAGGNNRFGTALREAAPLTHALLQTEAVRLLPGACYLRADEGFQIVDLGHHDAGTAHALLQAEVPRLLRRPQHGGPQPWTYEPKPGPPLATLLAAC